MSELVAMPVPFDTAREWVVKWHYSHAMPSTFDMHAVGVFDWPANGKPELVCVVTTSAPTNAHGVAAKYGLQRWPGNIEISRVVARPDAPANTASAAIACAARREYTARSIDWLFSYADTGQNHHGGIYQACNAVYLGMSDGRVGYLRDGRPVHPRSLVQQYGTHAWPLIQRLVANDGARLVRTTLGAKHLYVLPSRPAGRYIRRALRRYTQPYPKRTDTDHAVNRYLAGMAV